MSLDRTQILSTTLPMRTVAVPTWGGDVLVRKLPAAERVRWTSKYAGEVVGERAMAFLCELLVLSICDESGTPIMQADDVTALADKDWHAIEIVSAAALDLNGLGKDAIKDAKKN
jgi:hypothetical protein